MTREPEWSVQGERLGSEPLDFAKCFSVMNKLESRSASLVSGLRRNRGPQYLLPSN